MRSELRFRLLLLLVCRFQASERERERMRVAFPPLLANRRRKRGEGGGVFDESIAIGCWFLTTSIVCLRQFFISSWSSFGSQEKLASASEKSLEVGSEPCARVVVVTKQLPADSVWMSKFLNKASVIPSRLLVPIVWSGGK